VISPFANQLRTVNLVSDQQGLPITSREVSSYTSLAQWNLIGADAASRAVSVSEAVRSSEVRFSIHVKRRYQFYIWKVFLPLIVMVVISWGVLLIDPEDLTNQVQIGVTTILTVIAFAFAISSTLPKVPYLLYIDAFFLTCFLFVFLSIVELFAVHVAYRSQSERGIMIRRISRWIQPIAFVASNALVIAWFFG
jgi:hypothetical protein